MDITCTFECEHRKDGKCKGECMGDTTLYPPTDASLTYRQDIGLVIGGE